MKEKRKRKKRERLRGIEIEKLWRRLERIKGSREVLKK